MTTGNTGPTRRTLRRSIPAVFAIAVVAAALAACSPTSAAGGGEATTSGNCHKGSQVVFGASGALSGPAAQLGAAFQAGARLAAEEVNAAGGVNGSCVEVSFADDGGDPTKAAQVARRLIDQEQVSAYLGPFLSPSAVAVIPLTNKAGIIQILESSLATGGDASQHPYVFQTTSASATHAEVLGRDLVANGLTKVGIVAVNNEYGMGLLDAFKKVADKEGITITGTQLVTSGAVDMSSNLSALKSSGAEAVLGFSAIAPDNAAVVKGRNAIDWKVPILGVQSLADKPVTAAVGAAGMDGVYATWYSKLAYKGDNPDTLPEPTIKLRDALLAGGTLNQDSAVWLAATSYDSVWMLAKAFNAIGSTDAHKARTWLEQNHYQGVATDYVFTDTNHQGVQLDGISTVTASSNVKGMMQISPKIKAAQ